ncbi:hypothetical protein P7K49_015845 [Saguinus oedipus]|uniref:Uncharacterized protein n=1 Tax=Saguinus oedipus TaxID=9490 RepID=A0ABQ9VAD7_SAGOE|nr:hypothetical protein P7K49_015845 [Saguinus oedipus]
MTQDRTLQAVGEKNSELKDLQWERTGHDRQTPRHFLRLQQDEEGIEGPRDGRQSSQSDHDSSVIRPGRTEINQRGGGRSSLPSLPISCHQDCLVGSRGSVGVCRLQMSLDRALKVPGVGEKRDASSRLTQPAPAASSAGAAVGPETASFVSTASSSTTSGLFHSSS